MESIITKLFSDYLANQCVTSGLDYSQLAKHALEKEVKLRNILNEAQITCFEELLELTSQLHFLEVKDAFFSGCKLGATASKEFFI